jgi:post-GPI attachment to proteins factor 3
MGLVFSVSYSRCVVRIFVMQKTHINLCDLDLSTTEKLDYFSAAAAILFALFYTVIRLFHIYPQHSQMLEPQVQPTERVRRLWGTICSLAFLGHVSYLTLLPRFDYTYNMAFNLVIGMTHNILWLIYSLPPSLSLIRHFPARANSYRPSYAWKAAVFVLLTTAATALELFDFPPWYRAIDAHALWHLSTVPLIPYWYEFLIQDARDDGWRSTKQT